MFTIKTMDDLHKWIEKSHDKKLYVVGAGDYGEYIGEYLNKTDVKWHGYIDRRGCGVLNGKPVLGYDLITDNEAMYIISSVSLGETLTKQLLSHGIEKETIAGIKEKNIFGLMRLEANIPSHGSYSVTSGGELNPDKTFMVMERSHPFEGLFCDLLQYIRGCSYAEKKGFVPAIDDTFYIRLGYQNFDKLCAENAWDYYFEQPGGFALSEINKSKTIRHYNLDDSANAECMGEYARDIESMSKEQIQYWKAMLKKYMRPSAEMGERIEESYKQLFGRTEGKKVLGVSVRESYNVHANNKLSHCVIRLQPEMEAYLRDVGDKMKEYGCDYVFVICQATETIDLFKDRFGDKVIFTNRKRMSQKAIEEGASSFSHSFNFKSDKVSKTKDYMVDIYLLSRCDSLLCGWTHGNAAAFLLKDGEFDNVKIYKLGDSEW